MSLIEIIPYEKASGRLREIYDDIIAKRGKLADVHMIQSLHPESIVKHMELYMEIMFSRSPLSRAEREMMAVVVSVSNGCRYCCTHHGAALNHYWKDEKRLEKLIHDPEQAGLNERQKALCRFATQLSQSPADFEEGSFTRQMLAQGFTDRELLDATLVIAYFNFVNRIVLSLGLKPEADASEGYHY